MAKRKTISREIADKLRAHTRKMKREKFAEVCAKNKVETYGDVFNLFCGLSKRAIEIAAYNQIIRLSACGFSVKEIVDTMEYKK